MKSLTIIIGICFVKFILEDFADYTVFVYQDCIWQLTYSVQRTKFPSMYLIEVVIPIISDDCYFAIALKENLI